MKKVLLTSVAVLSLVVGAKVLADDANSYAAKTDTPATFSQIVGENGGDLTKPGHNIAKEPESSVNKSRRGGDDFTKVNHDHDGYIAKDNVDTSKEYQLTDKENPFPASEAPKSKEMKSAETPAKPAAPVMSQKAEKAAEAASKMSEGKAPSKTLPNTAAIK
ncbi:MAG: hypothetical protein Q4A87_01560 [Streptococcus sp.]|nr:hypothetical protein [Streptococcus sp.]